MVQNRFRQLPDQSRSGAPSKLSDEHRAQLMKWIDAEPLTSRALVNHMKTDWGVGISASTLRNELKRLGYVWKRTRYSLKLAQDEIRVAPI